MGGVACDPFPIVDTNKTFRYCDNITTKQRVQNMPGAKLKHKDESFDSLYKRYKRSVEKDGVLQEVRNREYYEKPSLIRKRAKAAAVKRQQRQAAIDNMSMEERKREAERAEKTAKKKEMSRRKRDTVTSPA